MTDIYLAEYDSRNFAFRSAGATRGEAVTALINGLEYHAMQYDLTMDWYYAETYGSAEEWAAEEATVQRMTIGRCTRDGSEIT
jgi:hypothetical protein